MKKNLIFICAFASGLGLLPMPYAYYVLLRLLFFGSLIFVGFAFYEVAKKIEPPLFIVGCLALLYNPIIPIHLGSKVIWLIVNLSTLAFMYWLTENKNRSN